MDLINFIKKHWEIIAGALALAGAIWGHIRYAIRRVLSVVLVTRQLDKAGTAIMLAYLCRLRRNRWDGGPFFIQALPVKTLQDYKTIPFHNVGGLGRIYWDGWRPIWVGAATSMPDDDGDVTVTGARISFVRFTFNWEDFLLRVCTFSDERGEDVTTNVTAAAGRYRVVIHEGSIRDESGDRASMKGVAADNRVSWNKDGLFRLIGTDPDEIGTWKSYRSNLALNPELGVIREEFHRFCQMRPWYEARGITWKRGWLLEGAPGTGKTSYVRALARELDWPIHVVDIGSMNNRDLRATWAKVTGDAPCIVVIEDIDAVFRGRENISKAAADRQGRDPLTFDVLLQVLDGVDQTNGIAVMITTNHPEVLDAALIRPGRIDRRVHFGPLKLEQRLEVARRIVGGAIGVRLAHEAGDIPAAQFQELCCREAIRLEFADGQNVAPVQHETPAPTRTRLEIVHDEDDSDDDDDDDDDEDDEVEVLAGVDGVYR